MPQLTERLLEKLEVKDERQTIRDTQKGFGLRVESRARGGRKSFFYNAKVCGHMVHRALGEWPARSVAMARSDAAELAGVAAKWKASGCAGENPFARKRHEGEGVETPTVRELVSAYVERYVKPTAKNPTRTAYDINLWLATHLKAWADLPLTSITIEHLLTVKARCGEHHVAYNRIAKFVSRLFRWANAKPDGRLNFWPCTNPAADVVLYPEAAGRKRYLLPDELKTFFAERLA
jgi:hypothetical protein